MDFTTIFLQSCILMLYHVSLYKKKIKQFIESYCSYRASPNLKININIGQILFYYHEDRVNWQNGRGGNCLQEDFFK